MQDLDKYADDLDYLDHDYDPARDDKMVEETIQLLGTAFPVAVLEKIKAHYAKKARDIEARIIPDMLMQADLTEAKTAAGLTVKLKTEYTVKTADSENMARWVESNGGESLYKRSLRFSKGEDISPIISEAKSQGISYEETLEIHPQTLKKFVQDFIEERGEFPPAEAGAVTMYTHAVLGRAK